MTGPLKYIFFLLIISFIHFSFRGNELPKKVWKKIDKSISKTWGGMEYVKTEFDYSSIKDDLKLNGNEKFFSLEDMASNHLGYLCISSAPSRYDVFELMVLFDPDLIVIKTEILTYREDYGGEIMSPRWLKQFIGKSADDPIKLDDDIQGISGATISVRSATFEIKKLTQIMRRIID